MNKNAKKWVRALRSGKYKQGRHQLRSGDQFCCLGVACDLAVKAKVIPPPVKDGRTFQYGREWLGLPDAVRNWLGLRTEIGHYGSNNALSTVNDGGKRFSTIAKIIESEPEGLFQ